MTAYWQLRSLPFDNLFVRLPVFGAGAGPLTLKRTTTALSELQAVGRPIVLDHVGGLVGTGLLAMGAASGIAHGISERDRRLAQPARAASG